MRVVGGGDLHHVIASWERESTQSNLLENSFQQRCWIEFKVIYSRYT